MTWGTGSAIMGQGFRAVAGDVRPRSMPAWHPGYGGMGRSRHKRASSAHTHGPRVDYYAWTTASVRLHGRDFSVWSKPGTLAHGDIDPAAALLAGAIEAGAGETVLDLNCGTGLVGAVAASLAPAGRVLMADSNIVEVEAARRTIAANALTNVEVYLSSGTSHLPPAVPVDLVTVRLPKGKLPTLQLIWDAFSVLTPGGRCYLAGANDEGIQSALRHAADLFGAMTTLAYRKGYRVGMAVKNDRPPALPDVFAVEFLDHQTFHRFSVDVRGERYQICSRPGVFAWDRLDEGSRALIDVMEIGPGDRVLDLGCGYGIVGAVAAKLAPAGMATLVDVELDALESAHRTVAVNGLLNCAVLPSDGAAAVRDLTFDVVATNPPFHVGKGTVYDAALQFIEDAAAILRPGGRLYLVANRFIPYETAIEQTFGTVVIAYQSPRYKVLMAQRAARQPVRRR